MKNPIVTLKTAHAALVAENAKKPNGKIEKHIKLLAKQIHQAEDEQGIISAPPPPDDEPEATAA